MKRLLPALVTAAVMAAAPSAMAFQTKDPVGDLLRQEAQASAGTRFDGDAVVEERPRDPYDPELEVTALLNADVAAVDREIEAANLRAERDYQYAQEEHRRVLEQQAADFAQAQAAHQDELMRQQAAYARAMDDWRRCSAGDRAYCLPE
jgi:hypothetical protein